LSAQISRRKIATARRAAEIRATIGKFTVDFPALCKMTRRGPDTSARQHLAEMQPASSHVVPNADVVEEKASEIKADEARYGQST
jgi:hypothetical protein